MLRFDSSAQCNPLVALPGKDPSNTAQRDSKPGAQNACRFQRSAGLVPRHDEHCRLIRWEF
jgi:hypothetical protein